MVEFHVLRCAICQTFQVLQVTKSSKWKCKLCGEKQSIIKVYGSGTGADCRKHVQKLNTLRGEIEQETQNNCLKSALSQNSPSNELDVISNNPPPVEKVSQWTKYVEGDEEKDIPEGPGRTEDCLLTTNYKEAYGAKKRKIGNQKGSYNKCTKYSDQVINQQETSKYCSMRSENYTVKKAFNPSHQNVQRGQHFIIPSLDKSSDANLHARKNYVINQSFHCMTEPEKVMPDAHNNLEHMQSAEFSQPKTKPDVELTHLKGQVSQINMAPKKQQIFSRKWSAFLEEKSSDDEDNDENFNEDNKLGEKMSGPVFVTSIGLSPQNDNFSEDEV